MDDLGADPLQSLAVGQIVLQAEPALAQLLFDALLFGQVHHADQGSSLLVGRLRQHGRQQEVNRRSTQRAKAGLRPDFGPAFGQGHEPLLQQGYRVGPQQGRERGDEFGLARGLEHGNGRIVGVEDANRFDGATFDVGMRAQPRLDVLPAGRIGGPQGVAQVRYVLFPQRRRHGIDDRPQAPLAGLDRLLGGFAGL